MLFLLFSFRGRINRGQYWFGALLVGFGSFVGQIGINSLVTTFLSPVTVPGLSGVTAIYGSGAGTCAKLADGKLRCWGDNQFSQLGSRVGFGLELWVPKFVAEPNVD